MIEMDPETPTRARVASAAKANEVPTPRLHLKALDKVSWGFARVQVIENSGARYREVASIFGSTVAKPLQSRRPNGPGFRVAFGRSDLPTIAPFSQTVHGSKSTTLRLTANRSAKLCA